MADTFTTNLNLTKPEVGGSTDSWGGKINSGLDTIDAIFSANGTEVNIRFNSANFDDNKKALFGTGDDLEIYHDGADSIIKDGGTGNLKLLASNLSVMNAGATQNYLTAADGGDLILYKAGTEKARTSTNGFSVTGELSATTGSIAGDLTQTTGGYLYSGSGNFNIQHTIASQNIVFSTTPSGGSVGEVLRITHDGKLSKLSGDLNIDVAGNLQIDADDNGEVRFLDGGTQYAAIKKDSNDAVVQSIVADGDLKFNGIDGSSVITALTLDMSDAGTGIFNHDVRVGDNNFFICGAGDDVAIQSDGTNGTIFAGNGNLTLDVAGDINIDADGGDIYFKDDGTEFLRLQNDSGNINIRQDTSDKDILFLGNDGGSSIVALTLDMSDGGAATFNNNVTAFSDERLKDNIETLEGGLAKVEQLRGVTYTRDGKESIGVIAQEVEKILPEIVLTADDEMGTKSVDYSRLTAVLIEAVKDLSAKVKELEGK